MRDAVIREVAMREVATFCRMGERAYAGLAAAGGQDAEAAFFHAHALLAFTGIVARLLWSHELAEGGRSLADSLDLPQRYHIDEDPVRERLEHYDRQLARGLRTVGGIGRFLDGNVGDRDAFEVENSFFVRHYDPTVETLTLLEEELLPGRYAAELADIRERVEAWLAANGVLDERPAVPRIPPAGGRTEGA